MAGLIRCVTSGSEAWSVGRTPDDIFEFSSFNSLFMLSQNFSIFTLCFACSTTRLAFFLSTASDCLQLGKRKFVVSHWSKEKVLLKVKGCVAPTHTPSPDSAADSMTCLNQGCEVAHSGVTTWADSVSSHLTSASFSRLRWRYGAGITFSQIYALIGAFAQESPSPGSICRIRQTSKQTQ